MSNATDFLIRSTQGLYHSGCRAGTGIVGFQLDSMRLAFRLLAGQAVWASDAVLWPYTIQFNELEELDRVLGLLRSRLDGDFHREWPGLTPVALVRETCAYFGRCGTSEELTGTGFVPAFRDAETGRVYRSRFMDGRCAPMHLLDGLPGELVVARDETGHVLCVKESVESGFERDNRFYTREMATQMLARC